jgi:hypothetical protein
MLFTEIETAAVLPAVWFAPAHEAETAINLCTALRVIAGGRDSIPDVALPVLIVPD